MKKSTWFLLFVPLTLVGCASVYYMTDVKDRFNSKKLPEKPEQSKPDVKAFNGRK